MATAKKTPASKTEPETQGQTENEFEKELANPSSGSSNQSPMLKKGGLWLNQTKAGEWYFSGYDGDLKLMIFKNKYKKEGDNQPAYNMYVAQKPRPEDATKKANQAKDDIPF